MHSTGLAACRIDALVSARCCALCFDRWTVACCPLQADITSCVFLNNSVTDSGAAVGAYYEGQVRRTMAVQRQLEPWFRILECHLAC